MEDLLKLMRSNAVNTIEYYNEIGKRQKKSYKEMYVDVISVYNMICEKGIVKGAKVGIVCSNKYEFIVLDLACIMGGFHFVSFHYEDFKNKINGLPKEFNLQILFVNENSLLNLETNDSVLSIKEISGVLDAQAEYFESDVPFSYEDVFTTIFTSGSTGTPKGIEVKYKSIKHFAEECISKFNLNSDDKTILFLPLSQYSSRGYVYSAIIIGYDLALTYPDKLMHDLKYYKPTVLQGVPYLFEGIYDTFSTYISSSMVKNFMFKMFLAFKRICPSGILIRKIQMKMFKDVHEFWGGRAKHMVTGAAPIRREVLQFFNDIGLGLYESYGLIETGVITLNYPGCQKIGSVGKVLPDKEITFDDNQQILVKSPFLWGSSYVNCTVEESRKLFLEDGRISTGDVGYVDKDGFLYLRGRIKDVIVLSNGTKVHPSILEKELNSSIIIKQSAIFGSNKPFLVAVIVKNGDGISNEEINEEVKKINNRLNSNHYVKGVVIAKEAFSTKNKLITGSMKLDRKRIYEEYKNELEKLYL